MTIKVKYQSRKVSTDDLPNFGGSFDPPLVFTVRDRATAQWQELAEEFENRLYEGQHDVEAAGKVILGIAYMISDGENSDSLSSQEDIQALHGAFPAEIADELLCDLAHKLAVEFYRFKTDQLLGLKKTSTPLSNGKAEVEKAKAKE